MKKHLKLWAFLLALLVALTAVLSACGAAKDDAEEDTEESETKKKNRPDYKEFSDDEAYRISFHTDENGACVADIDFNPYYDEPFKLIIPDTDDKGNPVVKITSNNQSAVLPTILSQEVGEELFGHVLTYFEGNEDNFYYRQFMSYYQLKGLEFCVSDRLKEDLLSAYPIIEIMNVYVYDPTATSIEALKLATRLKHAYPKMKDSDYYKTLQNMQKTCKKEGVEEAFLPDMLENYSGTGEYMTAIQWPSQIASVDCMTFFGCSRLETLAVPGTVELVEEGALGGCFNLKTVTFEEGVKEIGGRALYGCDKLEDVYLPASLELIGDMYQLEALMYEVVPYTKGGTVTIPNIHYNGTTEEWNALIQNSIDQGRLVRDGDLRHTYEYYNIHCTDGVLTAIPL